jgi:hypothetical protein
MVPTEAPTIRDESQLLTPETSIDQNQQDAFHAGYNGPDMSDMAKLPFSDFLRDVLFEQSMGQESKLNDVQGLSVLDFCDDGNLDLNDVDFGLLDHWNTDGVGFLDVDISVAQPVASGARELVTSDMENLRKKLVQIWTKSPWRWNPEKTDTAYTEACNLSLSTKDAAGDGQRLPSARLVNEKLHPSSRDKILAIVLTACNNNNVMRRIAASFPAAEVMDTWVHVFLSNNAHSVSPFIHYPSLSLNSQCPEWLAMAASAGASHFPIPTLRRFGFALLEAVRK